MFVWLLFFAGGVAAATSASSDVDDDRKNNKNSATTCGSILDGQHDCFLHSSGFKSCKRDHFYGNDACSPSLPDCPPFDPSCDICVNRSAFVSIHSSNAQKSSRDWCDKTIYENVELDGFLHCPSSDGPRVDGGTLDCKMNAISAEFGAVVLTNGGTLKNCLIEALDSSNSTIYMLGGGDNLIENVLSK